MSTKEPMVPAEVDLRGMPFMPLDVNRLRDSDLAITSTGDEFKAAVLLWCASWNQLPASSLPADDLSLAAYAGYGKQLAKWKRVKSGALRGFVQCSDGRYYHPVIAQKALEAWAERLEYREMKQNERERKERERKDRAEMFAKLRESGHVLPHNTPTGRLRELVASLDSSQGDSGSGHKEDTVTGHAPGTAKTGKGQGQGEGRELLKASSSHNTSADNSTSSAPELARVLRAMGWSECADGHPQLVTAKADGITAENIRAAAAGMSGKPISYIVARARGMRNDAAAGASGGSVHGSNVVVLNPAEVQVAAERRRIEDQLFTADNDLRLGLIDQATRDERVAGLRASLAQLAQAGSAGEARS